MARRRPTTKKSASKRTTTNKKAPNLYYEGFWGKTREKRAFADRHASTQSYIDHLGPRCEKLQYMLRAAGTFRLRKLPTTQYNAPE